MKLKAKRITASLLAMASAVSIMAVQVPVSAVIESAGAESLDFFAAVEGNATGNLRIRIISDDGNIEGIQFTLTKKGDSSFKLTGTTDKDGYLDIYDLEPDIYTVEEKIYPDYEGFIMKKDIQINAGVTSSTVFFNYIFNYIQHKGDADDNGEVGIGDVVAVAKYNANNLSYPLNNPLNADVNLDGTVNALDLTMLIEYNLNSGKWK